jgi:hypothetical protein
MQCRHGVLSLKHSLTGGLKVNGRTIDFGTGTGYIEKDWGCSFPDTFTWTQCNRFGEADCSIMASVAHIPYCGFAFEGCICCVYYNGKETRMATYRGVRILKNNGMELVLRQGKYLLEIEFLDERPHRLWAPIGGNMSRIIRESVACTVRYRFSQEGTKVFDLTSTQASFEYCAGKKQMEGQGAEGT